MPVKKQPEIAVEPIPDVTEDGFATVAEGAAFLRLCRSKVYDMMDAGEMPYAKFGKSRRIPWKALRDVAKSCMVSA